MGSNVFKGMHSFKRYQRFSIADIQQYWNQELHRLAGHSKYHIPQDDSGTALSDNAENPFLQLVDTISNMGKWVDKDGNFVKGETIERDLIEFVRRGELNAYAGISADSASRSQSRGLNGLCELQHLINRIIINTTIKIMVKTCLTFVLRVV